MVKLRALLETINVKPGNAAFVIAERGIVYAESSGQLAVCKPGRLAVLLNDRILKRAVLQHGALPEPVIAVGVFIRVGLPPSFVGNSALFQMRGAVCPVVFAPPCRSGIFKVSADKRSRETGSVFLHKFPLHTGKRGSILGVQGV